VVRLGDQKNVWPQILAALNDNIPNGVWITQMIPSYQGEQQGAVNRNGRGGGRDAQAGGQENPDEINVLIIDGLYHANAKTQVVDSARLGDYVNALAATPYFNIDTKKVSDTLVSFTTAETDPGSFAQKFSMRVKLKEPIILHP
jgi:hypothetical protein